MIFVTVGACDLQFDRLVKAVEALSGAGVFKEEVFLQIGHSVAPKAPLNFARFLSFKRMNEYAEQARVVVCQGGPGSIMLALTRRKVPIVVPRRKEFGEQVDDHQVLFTRKLDGEKRILAVYDTAQLGDALRDYDLKTADLRVGVEDLAQKAAEFAGRLESLILDYRASRDRTRT